MKLTIHTPDDAEVAEMLPEDDGVHSLTSEAYGIPEYTVMPKGISERLDELGELIDADTAPYPATTSASQSRPPPSDVPFATATSSGRNTSLSLRSGSASSGTNGHRTRRSRFRPGLAGPPSDRPPSRHRSPFPLIWGREASMS